MEKVRMGFIGAGKIMPRIIKGARLCKDVEIFAVGSRDPKHAEAFAKQQGIPYNGTIDNVLAENSIDAVYIAVPNQAHYEICMKALKSGKHVILEKPMFGTMEELNNAFDLANNQKLVLMEAFKGLFLPLTAKIKKIIASGELGQIIYMDGKYSYNGNFPKDHWVNDPVYGGGLRDVGTYPLTYFNYLMDSKIASLNVEANYDKNNIDNFSSCLIKYENGVIAQVCGGNGVATENKAMIYGTKGYLELPSFWKSGEGTIVKGDYHSPVKAEMKSDFYYEIEHFAKLILNNEKESPIASRAFSTEIERIMEYKKATK